MDIVGPPEQLWWNPSSTNVGITLKSRLDAVKVLVHQPNLVNATVQRRAPLHDDIRPEIFGVDFDLGFRTFGIRNSDLLRRCLGAHPCARPGALVLKEWSKSSGVNNSMNGFLTSYAINILWIYFLVQKKLIPHIDPHDVPNSLVNNSNFDPVYLPLVPQSMTPEGVAKLHLEMGRLLMGFFRFYCFEFDWTKNVVSLNRPGITTKEQLGWTESGEIHMGKPGKNVRYTMCIEDPYEDNLNLGRHIGACRWRKVLTEFQRALVSLAKDSVDQSSVFSWMSSGADDAETKSSQPPPLEYIARLMAIAVEQIESREDLSIHKVDLIRCFEKEAPVEWAAVSAFYKWKELISELGYHVAGNKVRARRNIGAKPAKSVRAPEGGEAKNKASSGPISPIDALTDELIAEYIAEHAKGNIPLQPDWLVWNSPTQSTIHMPGHRSGSASGPVKVSFACPSQQPSQLQCMPPQTSWSPQPLVVGSTAPAMVQLSAAVKTAKSAAIGNQLLRKWLIRH